MFLKLGETYNATLLVTDINGVRITNDTPTVTIFDVQEDKYWNGITWQNTQYEIILSHVDNGVYSYSFISDKTGIFNINISSSTYSISKSEGLEIYDGDIVKYEWLIDNVFTIKYNGTSPSETVNLKILREIDRMYFDGANWVSSETVLTMPLLDGNVYSYDFLPDVESEYNITIYTDDIEIFYIIDVHPSADNIPPVLVSSTTLQSLDGTDSIVQNEQGAPLVGVNITIFNSTTKEVVGKTVTNDLGEWNVMLKPGNYYFSFDKGGYISIGFERSVV